MAPRCANCGKDESAARQRIAGDDGEWFCSAGCYDEHEFLGCPFEHGVRYRTPTAIGRENL